MVSSDCRPFWCSLSWVSSSVFYLLTVFAQILFWRSHSASCDSSCGPRAGPFDSSFHLAASRTVSSATLMVGFLVGWTNLVALPLQQFLVKLLFPLQQFLRYDCFFISTVHFFSSSNFFPSLGGTVLTFTFSPSLHLELLFSNIHRWVFCIFSSLVASSS